VEPDMRVTRTFEFIETLITEKEEFPVRERKKSPETNRKSLHQLLNDIHYRDGLNGDKNSQKTVGI
jgi:hypothetical protein